MDRRNVYGPSSEEEYHGVNCQCDLCGGDLKSGSHSMGNGSEFCRGCYQEVGQVGGYLHDAILKYSIGNVV